jgi:hypothetical protein
VKKLTPYMINVIQYGGETRNDEFKPPMGWFKANKKRKFALLRAALALTNTPGGGYIYIGISQRRDRTKGLISKRRGLDDNQYNSFCSPDDIGRFFRNKSSHSIEFTLHSGVVKINNRDKRFVVMRIFESKNYLPVTCTWNNTSSQQECRLVKDAIYIRSFVEPIESKRISTIEEWEEMMRRLLSYKESILHKDLVAVCRLIKEPKRLRVKKRGITKKAKLQYDKERKNG